MLEKFYRLAIRKLSEVELEWEELSTKIDEANQTIEALRFENNFLAEKTNKLDAKLFQVRVQLERTSSAKLNERLNFQKAASDKLVLGRITHSLLVVLPLVLWIMLCLFLLLLIKPDITEPKIENVSEGKHDKGKSILGALPKIAKESE